MTTKDAEGNSPAIVPPVVLTFETTDTKLYVDCILNHLIDPKFANVNRLFVLLITRTDMRDYKNSFSNYYVPDAKIEGFNVLIDRKSLFDLPVKNKEEAYEKIIEMSNYND